MASWARWLRTCHKRPLNMFKQLFGQKKNTEVPADNPGTQSPVTEEKGGLNKLKAALGLTGQSLINKVVALGRQSEAPLDEATLDEMEETLIQADVGLDLAVDMVDRIRENPDIQTPEKLKTFLRDEFSKVLAFEPGANQLRYAPGQLNIYLVVGVNGSGKTTLIGKLANRFVKQGKKVILAAGDTFRAAAEDQLEIWAERSGAQLVRKDNADAAAVIFDSIDRAIEEQADILIVDTAGRLQNKFNLMEELKKVKQIIDRKAPEAHSFESLLVLDATTGQNALKQAEVFMEAVQLTGVALTKLDGSAKGGIILNIAKNYKLPVKLVGVGETIDDIRDFDPHDFIDGLFQQ